jgi:hypothetical protein
MFFMFYWILLESFFFSFFFQGWCLSNADALKKTFGQLGFDVIVKENLKSVEIVHLMWEMATKDHTDYDCFIACFLSHGCLGMVFKLLFKKVKEYCPAGSVSVVQPSCCFVHGASKPWLF